MHCHYGIRYRKTIPIMVLEAYFHNGSVYGPSGIMAPEWVLGFRALGARVWDLSVPVQQILGAVRNIYGAGRSVRG